MAEGMGDRIAHLIEERHLSQREFALLIGTTEASVSRYINNAREPNAKTLRRMADVLQTTTDEIVGRDDESDIATELPRIKVLLARNAQCLTQEQKIDIIRALLSDSKEDASGF